MKKKKYVIAGAVSLAAAGITKISRLINHGSKYNLNYLNTVKKVTDKIITFEKEEDGFYAIKNPEDKTLKILQLSDLHIGGGYLSRHEDRLVFKTIHELAQKHKPDLIVLTGDLVCSKPSISMSRNNKNSLVQIVMLLERIGIPYAVTFGNKDSEVYATHSRNSLRKYLMKQNHCLMAWDGEDITGSSNYLIKIRDGKDNITGILYFLDTNSYIYSGLKRKKYDSIHDDQVKWYEAQVKRFKRADGKIVPSCMFIHMPLPEYSEAWKKYSDGSSQVKFLGGKVSETISCPKLNSKMFDTVKKLGSTKAIFCGHDHLNNFSFLYKGIRLVCGKSLDYILYGKNISGHRGGTVLYMTSDGQILTK